MLSARAPDMLSTTLSTSSSPARVPGMSYEGVQGQNGANTQDRNKITFIAWSPDDAGIMVG